MTLPADIDMLSSWRAHRTGLAPYYPLLYSLAIGMGAQRVFEFGHGESTAILHSAMQQTGGVLVQTVPPESCCSLICDHGPLTPGPIQQSPHWRQYACLSSQALPQLGPEDIFDLVLHDGSHSAEVVAADLKGILPRVRQGGLVLIHDTLHSYVGEQMRRGITIGKKDYDMFGLDQVTLPFAFGLTILQVVVGNRRNGPVSMGPEKPTSQHRTLRISE